MPGSPVLVAAAAAAAGAAAAVGLLGAGPPPASVGAVPSNPGVGLTAPAIDAGRGVVGPVPVGRRWQWPVQPRPPVIRPFVAPVSAYAAGHRGLDLAASEGAAVLAVEAGVVVHAGVVAGRGTVSVEHADGLLSTYEPVAASVMAGDAVSVGDRLGSLERTAAVGHCGPTSCLHLGARRGGDYLDPLPLLAGGRVILLPFH